MTETEKLGERIDEILIDVVTDFKFLDAGLSDRLRYRDKILQACKESGLKFVERRWNEEVGDYFMKIADYFCTESQAAELLGVNRVTIWRWINSGKFNIQRVGREVLIPKWEVDLIRGNRGQGGVSQQARRGFL